MIENYPRTAPELWAFILGRNFLGPHPILSVQGASYAVREHGLPSRNRSIHEDLGPKLKADIVSHRIDGSDTRWYGRTVGGSTGYPETFAIASPFDVWTDGAKSARELEAFSRSIGRHRGTMIRDLRNRHVVWPQAMLTADFDVSNTRENLIMIGEMLNRGRQRQRWILDSGRGFHLIEEELFTPNYYPLYVGQIILDFERTASVSDRPAIREFGNSLVSHWKDLDRVDTWTREALRAFKHYGSAGPGMTFSLDMRYFAHALAEWLGFMKTGNGGFGFLRIIGKGPDDPPPAVVAMKWPYCNTQFSDLGRYRTC